MNFTPNDLQNIELNKAIRGYDTEEVRDLLSRIIEDYSMFINENLELKGRVAILNEGIQHYKNIEESLNSTLLLAQQTGEDIKKSSYEKADNIIRDAESQAHQIVNRANSEVMRLKYNYEELKRSLTAFRAKSESLIKYQLESLKEVIGNESMEFNINEETHNQQVMSNA